MKTAMYLRISSEDEDLRTGEKDESESISNQRSLLREYVSGHAELAGSEILEFCDDGWSGTNFERPAVKELLEQVRRGQINCILVKDLSRFGRDYLTVGDYISRVFPFLGVRFISVNDGFDSSNPLDIDSLDTSFRTLIYDLYSRDLSRRVKNAKKSTGRVRGISQSLCAVWIRQRPGGQKSSSDRYRSRRGDTAHLSNGSGWCKNMGDCGGAERRGRKLSKELQSRDRLHKNAVAQYSGGKLLDGRSGRKVPAGRAVYWKDGVRQTKPGYCRQYAHGQNHPQ